MNTAWLVSGQAHLRKIYTGKFTIYHFLRCLHNVVVIYWVGNCDVSTVSPRSSPRTKPPFPWLKKCSYLKMIIYTHYFHYFVTAFGITVSLLLMAAILTSTPKSLQVSSFEAYLLMKHHLDILNTHLLLRLERFRFDCSRHADYWEVVSIFKLIRRYYFTLTETLTLTLDSWSTCRPSSGRLLVPAFA